MRSIRSRAATVATLVVATLSLSACASSGSTATESDATSTSTTTATSKPVDPTDITHVQLTLEDTSRPAVDPIGERTAPTRKLPTELYLPASTEPAPLIVFAHGFNGDPSKFSELFTHWAEAGFAVLAPQFPVTHTTTEANPIQRAADIAEQPADLSFVLDELLAGEHASRVDEKQIGVAGLSLGGGTTWGVISDECCVDERFRAAIVMDGNRFGFGDETYVPNGIPVMVFHAKTDVALSYDAARTAYEQSLPPKYFVTIFQAIHAEPFEDTPHASDEMVKESSTTFFRAYLLDDAKARAGIVASGTVDGISEAETATG